MMARILIACEFSGVVRRAFAALGHDVYSCDLLPSTDNSEKHIIGDCRDYLDDGWDLMIAHPECTYITCAAEWAYKDGPYHQKVKPETLVGEDRRKARAEAIDFVKLLLNVPISHIAIENPVGVLSRHIGKPTCIVQPYEFGDDASKKTCFWTKNLPPLQPTKYIEPRIVNGKKRWANQTNSGQNNLSPSEDRWKERSITYQGIADAMADQWGRLLA